MKLKQILILQNKIDLIKESQAKEQYEEITKFVQGTVAEGAPIIPISAQLKYNIDVLCEYIVNKIPVPPRDFNAPPRLIVIRSFDVNKPGCEVADLKGGVAGGSILSGVLKVGQEIEVRPGVVTKDSDGNITCRPIFSRIVSLFAEQNELQYAVPGGLIGVGTKIDPTLCRADRLVGQVLGAVGQLPDIYQELEISYYLLRRLLGVRTDGDKKGARVEKLQKNEILLVNIGSLSTGGRISATKGDLAKIVLTTPVCTEKGEKIALSRRCGCVSIGGGAVQLGSLWHARHSARFSGVRAVVNYEIFDQKAAVQLSRREAKRIFTLRLRSTEMRVLSILSIAKPPAPLCSTAPHYRALTALLQHAPTIDITAFVICLRLSGANILRYRDLMPSCSS